jgi:hypothetical protein
MNYLIVKFDKRHHLIGDKLLFTDEISKILSSGI